MDDDDEEAELEYVSLLADQLNELLHLLDIHLSIPIESPTDLTPSLLMAILESLLETHIPIDEFTPSASKLEPEGAENLKRIQSMKIFLGMLEHDILGMDVGLSDVDPRCLARGEWDEVIYVAEVLCWVGAQLREAYQTPMDQTVVIPNLVVSTPKGKQVFVDHEDLGEELTIGLGIYESSVNYSPPKIPTGHGISYDPPALCPPIGASPSLLSNDLSSDVELNASFTLRVPSICCSECGREQIEVFDTALPPFACHGFYPQPVAGEEQTP